MPEKTGSKKNSWEASHAANSYQLIRIRYAGGVLTSRNFI
jgi:hypothetical protein